MSWDWRQSREEFHWIGAVAALTAGVFLISLIAGYWCGVPAHRVALRYAAFIWLVGPLAVFLAAVPLAIRAVVLRVPNPLQECIPFARERFGTPALAAASLAPILLMPLLMGSFGTLKMLMPLAVDFSWDDRFAAADRLLFFGYQPWQLTHALFGSAFATHIIDYVYSLWVAFLFMAVLFFSLLAPREVRARFFLSFAGGWILIGVLGAYVFASAGPCYAELIGARSAPEFAPLMERLKAIHEGGTPLGAYEWQQVLWQSYVERDYGFAKGISAMPSMHNAITVLYALSLAGAARPYRLAAWALVGLIFIGSIHLGWHYAVDGIAGGLMMWGIWVAAGAWLNRIGYTAAVRREAQRELPELFPEPVAP
jgi:hypothetical protein